MNGFYDILKLKQPFLKMLYAGWTSSEIDLGPYVWANSSAENLTNGRYLLAQIAATGVL